jgi:hypothetical protein
VRAGSVRARRVKFPQIFRLVGTDYSLGFDSKRAKAGARRDASHERLLDQRDEEETRQIAPRFVPSSSSSCWLAAAAGSEVPYSCGKERPLKKKGISALRPLGSNE